MEALLVLLGAQPLIRYPAVRTALYGLVPVYGVSVLYLTALYMRSPGVQNR